MSKLTDSSDSGRIEILIAQYNSFFASWFPRKNQGKSAAPKCQKNSCIFA